MYVLCVCIKILLSPYLHASGPHLPTSLEANPLSFPRTATTHSMSPIGWVLSFCPWLLTTLTRYWRTGTLDWALERGGRQWTPFPMWIELYLVLFASIKLLPWKKAMWVYVCTHTVQQQWYVFLLHMCALGFWRVAVSNSDFHSFLEERRLQESDINETEEQFSVSF